MAKLILLRHGESEWNKLNLFTGWEDVGLSEKGIEEAKWAGQILLQKGILPDICFTSLLKRAVRTLNYVLEETDLEWLPVVKTVMLNERHYGILQGLNKAETAIKYGEEQVRIWRRSYDVRPPAINEDDPRNPRLQKKYADSKIRPLCESLEDVVNRVFPYYDTNVLPLLWRGKNVLISAHGNTLRALCKTLDNLSEEELSRLEIPTGVPIVYTIYGHGTIQAKQLLY